MLGMALATVILQAVAPQASTEVELYGGLKAGMTKAEANAVLPDKERFLTSNCQIMIMKHFSNGRLDVVILRNKWTGYKKDCYVPMFDSLIEKYGPPTITRHEEAIGTIIPAGEIIGWQDGERLIQLERRGYDTLLYYRAQSYRRVEKIEGL